MAHPSNSNTFKPNKLGLPKDPFAAKPWIIDLDVLPIPYDRHDHSSLLQTTILVLGTPPPDDLLALVNSTILQDSILLIATHDVKGVASALLSRSSGGKPHVKGPTTRILRLQSPLFSVASINPSQPQPKAAGGSDALRVMTLLNRASQVVTSVEPGTARDSDPAYRIQQLSEHPLTGDFTVPETLGATSPTSIPVGPLLRSGQSSLPISNQGNLVSAGATSRTDKRRTLTNFFGLGTSPPASKLSNAAIQRTGLHEKAPFLQAGGGRAFDTLINYLSGSSFIPEKVLLKQAILVTTLSAPYLSVGSSQSSGLANLNPLLSASTAQVSKEKRVSALSVALARFSTRGGGHANADARVEKRNTLKATHRQPEGYGQWEVVRLPKYRGAAHIVHVLPDTPIFQNTASSAPSSSRPSTDAAKPSPPKLVTSLEQFQLAFAYPSGGASMRASASANAAPRGRGNPGKMSASMSSPALPYGRTGLLTPTSTLMPPVNGPYGHHNSLVPSLSSAGASDSFGGVKPMPYVLRAGVLGGTFSLSYPTEGDNEVQTLSIADLILLGALDGSVAEHGGAKAWVGQLCAREVVNALVLKRVGVVEIRNSETNFVVEKVWLGGESDVPQIHAPHPERRTSVSRPQRHTTLPPILPPKDMVSPSSQPRRVSVSRVSRKPAPSLAPSESTQNAWQAVADKPLPPSKDIVERKESPRKKDKEARQVVDRDRTPTPRERAAPTSRDRSQSRVRDQNASVYEDRDNAQRDRERREAGRREAERREAERREAERLEAERLEAERREEEGRLREQQRRKAALQEEERAREKYLREVEKAKHRAREAERIPRRERSRNRDTGLLTPPGSGSDLEVEVNFDRGLDSPVEPSQGFADAILGTTAARSPSLRDYPRRQESVTRGHEDTSITHRKTEGSEVGRSSSRRPAMSSRGASEPTSRRTDRIPPSGSTESTRKAANESFDIVPYYEYERSKQQGDRDRRERDRDSRRAERDYERDRERRRDGERDRAREGDGKWDSWYSPRNDGREPRVDSSRTRERDREREDRYRDRSRARDINYMNGELGPPPAPSQAYSRREREEERARRPSSSQRHYDYEDTDDDYRRRRARKRSERDHESARADGLTKEVTYYTLDGDEIQSRPRISSPRRMVYDESPRDEQREPEREKETSHRTTTRRYKRSTAGSLVRDY